MVIKTTPQILERVSLRFFPDPAYEDSNTIALNVGGYFMDLRVATADGSLQWSRSGERKTLKTDPLTFQWTRIIDSTGGRNPDEAAFEELPNGDDLEFGTFAKDGVPTKYEEVWRDVTKRIEGDNCAWILQSTDGCAFLGKLGNTFMGMRQEEDGTFAVRKETYDELAKEWRTAVEFGPVQSIATVAEAPQLQSQTDKVGEKVEVGGGEYVIRGIDV